MRQNSKKQAESNFKTSLSAGLFSPEILAPAGSMVGLVGAINAGADAVYLGGEMFSARAYAENFTTEEILKGIEYAHIHGAKVYITINTLLKNKEISKLCDYVEPLYLGGIDGVIVQDLGVLETLHNVFPDLPLHASTQMAVSSYLGAKALIEKYDVKRVVLARECKLSEIKAIIDCGIETECFVHGSMCYCVSGQCLFSSMVGGRSGNRGRCAQSCRLPYRLNGNSNEEYLLSLKDMCTLEYLPELIKSGITSFKIEGRMKSPAYAAGVTAIYRKYVDKVLSDPDNYTVDKKDLETIKKLYIRTELQTGYYDKYRSKSMVTINNPAYSKTDDALIDSLLNKYCNTYEKIHISGLFSAITGQKLSLKLYSDDLGVEYTQEGDEVLTAQNRPLSQADVLKAVNKFGDTFFELNDLQCSISDDAFATVGSLKDLRRRAVAGLISKIDSNTRDEAMINTYYKDYVLGVCDHRNSEKTTNDFVVFCNTFNQLKKCLSYSGVGEIVISSSLARQEAVKKLIKEAEKKVFIKLPELIRLEMLKDLEDICIDLLTLDNFGGIYVNQIDSYFLANQVKAKSNKNFEIRGDIHLYQNNNMAVSSMEGLLDSYTVSQELNKDELMHMNNVKGEALVYGRVPLMVTANCVRLSKGMCLKYDTKSGDKTSLCDRKNQIEPVITHCDEKVCYNTIYNNLPTSLHKNMGLVKDLGFRRLQIRFTFEDDFEVGNVLKVFCEDFSEVEYKYTNGHFNRGVE